MLIPLKSSGRSNYDVGYNILHIQCDNDFNSFNLLDKGGRSCTIGDLVIVLFFIVFSPIAWIVIGICELAEKGFFKKVIWKRNKK